MQVCAWVGMLVSYSQNDGIVQAAKDTFSGEKPCELCCKIAAARKQENESKEPLAPLTSTLSMKQLQEILPTAEIHLNFPRPTEPPLQAPPESPWPLGSGWPRRLHRRLAARHDHAHGIVTDCRL